MGVGKRFSGSVALVTTASSGIGPAIRGVKGSARGPHEGSTAIDLHTESTTVDQDAPLG